MTVLEAIQNWAEEYQEKQFKLRVAGSISCAILSIPVLWVTWWIVWFVLWFAFSLSGATLIIVSWIIFALLFVAHLTANYQQLENLEFGDQEHVRKVQIFARATGRGYMSVFANQETAHSFVKVLSVSILAGPALVMTSIRLASQARQMLKLEPEFVTPFLIILAKAGKRVPMEKLATELNGRLLADLITQMSLIDGVVVRTEGKPGMYLTEDFQTTLTKVRNERKGQS